MSGGCKATDTPHAGYPHACEFTFTTRFVCQARISRSQPFGCHFSGLDAAVDVRDLARQLLDTLKDGVARMTAHVRQVVVRLLAEGDVE